MLFLFFLYLPSKPRKRELQKRSFFMKKNALLAAALIVLVAAGAFAQTESDFTVEKTPDGKGITITSITIPDSVTTIGGAAFDSCAELTTITMGTGIKSLGSNMTQYCQKLARVTFLGTIPVKGFASFGVFYGDLQYKFYAADKGNGTPGTYVAGKLPVNNFTTWMKQ
jgi:hypothetical protein